MTTAQISYEPIIGLEIHVQLQTASKLFCSCPVTFGEAPNSRVCPVCLGLPGSLPVINRQAVHLGLILAAALECRIGGKTKWDRKSYYYPDLPKNYQISQFDLPLGGPGSFTFSHDGAQRTIRIRRAHLEEDAGKNLHDRPGVTCVDLNRTGTPLLEIVTEPDLHSAEEAYDCCTALQSLATYLGVTEGVMQKGQMRFEPNINVIIRRGAETLSTPICEVKNLNSFRAIRGAVAYEIKRQVDAWHADPTYTLEHAGRENRGWDDDREVTLFQRGKEEAHDYRYFPDPDLVPLHISEDWLTAVRADLPELPAARQARIADRTGLPPQEAAQLVQDRLSADLFDAALDHAPDARVLGKQFINLWARLANARGCTIAGLGVEARRIAALASLVHDGTLNATAAATVAERMLERSDDPGHIAKDEGLEQISDLAAVEELVRQAIASNPAAVEIIQSGGKKMDKSIGFLLGQVMRASRGSAPPDQVRILLRSKLGLDPQE